MKVHSTSLSFDFSHPIDRIWEIISNTDRMDRSIGLPPVKYEVKPYPPGGSKRLAKHKILGITLVWDDNPYEWVQNQVLSVERPFRTGPLRVIRLRWDFESIPQGCRVTQRIDFEPSHLLTFPLVFFQINFDVRPSFLRFYESVEATLNALKTRGASLVPMEVFNSLDTPFKPEKSVVRRTQERLYDAKIDESLHPKLTEMLLHWQEPELVRIRPFVVAHQWNMEREQTLSALLSATKAGLFDLSWDLICPGCKGAKVRTSSLMDLKKEAHCNSCNIRFDAQFDKSVELSFTPSPAIRKIEALEYCAGSPQNTQHFLAQFRIQPGETKSFSIDLRPGRYRIRSLQSKTLYQIQVESTASARQCISLKFEPELSEEITIPTKEGVNEFKAVNHSSDEIVIHLERGEHHEAACTAAFVSSFQDFRDLFSSEVLNAGVELSVSSVTVLFTDLKDSTALYRKIGDAKAFGLVNDHLKMLTQCIRRTHGAVIKTIGDAIMASFVRPEDALYAALEIRSAMLGAPAVPELGERLQIKIGIHTGPCFVVNSNEGLDYFGSTVNLAARTQNACEDSGILITGKMLDDPGVKDALRKTHTTAEQIVRKVKGFEGEFELYQVGLPSA